MAVPVARTWADDDSLDTTNLNTGVRDPIEFAKNPPSAVAERSTVQSIPNLASTAIIFDVQHFDNDDMFAPTSTTITITETGLYDLGGSVTWAANATGNRQLQINVNGTLVVYEVRPAMTGGAETGQSVSIRRSLTAGDTITLVASQTSGGALNVSTTFRPFLSVCRVSGS